MINKIDSTPNIKVRLQTELTGVGGVVGNYEVSLKQDGAETKEIVGSIVVATGAVPLKPEGLFGYDGKKVITQFELEGMLNDGSLSAKNIVMIQCAGARSAERSYCARICCLTAVKNSIYIRAHDPHANVHILYRDIQMYGTENEKLLWDSRGQGVKFDIYDAATPPVVKDGVVELYQPLTGMTVEIPYDLVVLSTPLVAPADSPAVANFMRIPIDGNKFFLEAHAKLRPLDFATDGIYLAGTARYPATVPEAEAQGLGAAARANTVLSKDKLVFSALVSHVTDRCDGCGLCVELCPYKALSLEEYEKEGRKCKRNRSDNILCKGCGLCAATCPKGGIVVHGFTRRQLEAQVDAALEFSTGTAL
jgi:heterodisulfide reductase subunit A